VATIANPLTLRNIPIRHYAHLGEVEGIATLVAGGYSFRAEAAAYCARERAQTPPPAPSSPEEAQRALAWYWRQEELAREDDARRAAAEER